MENITGWVLQTCYSREEWTKTQCIVFSGDIRTAFDVARHNGIWEASKETGTESKTRAAMHIHYGENTSTVEIDGEVSITFAQECGSHQGGVGSPLEWNKCIGNLFCDAVKRLGEEAIRSVCGDEEDINRKEHSHAVWARQRYSNSKIAKGIAEKDRRHKCRRGSSGI